MKIYNKTLKKAYKLLRKGQSGKVIAFLEPKVPLFLENFHFYYILGVACLRNGDNGGADTYLKRAVQVKRNAVEPRLYLAVLALKKKDTTEAVRLWLGILDIDSTCKAAKKGLDRIRRISDSESLDRYLVKSDFKALLPALRPAFPVFRVLLAATVLLAGSLVFVQKDNFAQIIKGGQEKISRENLSFLMKDLKDQKLSEDALQGFIYNLSDDEIMATLKTAHSFFDSYQDNRAMKEINRVLYSNASEPAKQKARILEAYLKQPDPGSFENMYDYEEVFEDPYLYNKCYIRWKGRFSNIQMVEPGMSFDFLVGYDTSQVLEGIVPAYTDFQVRLDSALPLEIMAQVEVLDRNRFQLKVLSVRNLIDPQS